MLNYILMFLSKCLIPAMVFVSALCFSPESFSKEGIIDYAIQYKINKNDDYGAIVNITNRFIEIRYMGNQYAQDINVLGYYKGEITDKEYLDVVDLAMNSNFLNARDDKSISPGDPYILITLTQGENKIASKAYLGGAYDDHSRTLQTYLYDIMMKYMAILQPEIGLSLTCGKPYKKDDGYVFLDFIVRNEGTSDITILTSDSHSITGYLTVLFEQSRLETAKYFTQDSMVNMPKNSTELLPGADITLTYRFSASELPDTIGDIGFSHTISIEDHKTHKIHSLHFASVSKIVPMYVSGNS